MPYVVPASKKSVKQNQFEVEAGGTLYTLPSLKYVKPDLLVETEKIGQQLTATKAMFEAYAPGLFAQFDDAEQLEELMTAWQEHSGITVGESQASAGS